MIGDASHRKIAFIINKLGVGGAENVFIRDANILYEKGYQVRFIILFGEEKEQTLLNKLKIPPENVFYCHGESLLDIEGFMRCKDFVLSEDIEVAYSTLNEANIWCRLLRLFTPGIHAVIREANLADAKPFKFKLIDLLLYPLTDKIAAVSKGVKRSLRYLPQRKIVILENGVEVPETAEYVSKPDGKIIRPKLIFVGSLTAKKNVQFLIEGVKRLKDMDRDFILEIIGDGPEMDNLKDLVISCGLEGKVIFLGVLESDKLVACYRASDIFILPSRIEGSPNVLLEAMASGLPIITSDFFGARDIVIDKENGLVVPQGDRDGLARAIIFYSDHPDERRRMSRNGYDLVRARYAIEAHIENLEKMLDSILYEKARR